MGIEENIGDQLMFDGEKENERETIVFSFPISDEKGGGFLLYDPFFEVVRKTAEEISREQEILKNGSMYFG